MIDRSRFDVEDFLIDNTFQLFCAGTDKLCVAYWEKYIDAHPEQTKVITEAKRLYVILSGNKKALNNQVENLKESIFPSVKSIKITKNYTWLKIVAAIILSVGIAFLYHHYSLDKAIIHDDLKAQVFTTKSGERKKITLPDGSVILLNAKSSLSIGKEFNDKRREVVLKGEAYFDVVHDKDKPFQVHTEDFNINVLGTTFNVKAYPDEITSEATLIHGLIMMEALNGNGGTITLKPSQKVIFYKNNIPVKKNTRIVKTLGLQPEIIINHYRLIKDSTIVETAWTQNRIEIYDQDFAEIRGVLEKWYNVEIKFMNPEIEKYRFTATFSHETIDQVLKALQDVENFKYEIKENQIIISK